MILILVLLWSLALCNQSVAIFKLTSGLCNPDQTDEELCSNCSQFIVCNDHFEVIELKKILNPVLPTEIGYLKSLRKLDTNTIVLNKTALGGTIPTEIGHLTSLQHLLIRNQDIILIGSIPSEIWQLTKLQVLSLNHNINFGYFSINGSLPSDIRLTSLQYLSLINYQITGTIPTEIGRLSILKTFDLVNLRLSGTLPTEIGRLASLEYFRLQYFDDSRYISRIQITGSIPTEIGLLTSLRIMKIRNTILNGTIPKEIFHISTLQSIELSYSQFSGIIPSEMGNLTSLTDLSLMKTQISGTIPTEIGYLTSLRTLSLFSTQINGSLVTEIGGICSPKIGLLTSLQYLYFYKMGIDGVIPTEIGNLTNLIELDLSRNKLNGTIPTEISLLTKLKSLYLSQNFIHGPLPLNFGNLSLLRELDLYLTDYYNYDKGCISSIEFYDPHEKRCVSCFLGRTIVPNQNSDFMKEWRETISTIMNTQSKYNITTLEYCYCDQCIDGKYEFKQNYNEVCPNADNYLNTRSFIQCQFPCSIMDIKYNESLRVITQNITIELNRGKVIFDIVQLMFGVDITIGTEIQEYQRFVLYDWVFRYILKLESYYFFVSYSKCIPGDNTHTQINDIISNFSTNILSSSLLGGDREIVISSITSNCTSIVFISDTLSLPIKIILYTVLGIILLSSSVIVIVLFKLGYLNWIIYYFKRNLFSLPIHVSWSLLLYLKYPYKWEYTGTKKSGFYSYEFENGSAEWNKTESLFNDHLGGSKLGNNCIESIIAIYNPTLTLSFVNKWNGIATRVEMNSLLFKKDFKENVIGSDIEIENIRKWNLLRENTYQSYLDFVMKLGYANERNNPVLIPVVHGTGYAKSQFICMTGFASLSLVDAGYYGKGIYFTSSSFYSLPYLVISPKPSLIISWIIPGNVYPVIESPGIGNNKQPSVTGKSLLALPLKPGFDSHYVQTTIDGYPFHMNNNDLANIYDEFVVVQEHQILPVFILKFNELEIQKFFSIYKLEVSSLNKNSNNTNEISILSENTIKSGQSIYLGNLIDEKSIISNEPENSNINIAKLMDLEMIMLQRENQLSHEIKYLQDNAILLNQENENLKKKILKFNNTNDSLSIDNRFREDKDTLNGISLVNLVSGDEYSG